MIRLFPFTLSRSVFLSSPMRDCRGWPACVAPSDRSFSSRVGFAISGGAVGTCLARFSFSDLRLDRVDAVETLSLGQKLKRLLTGFGKDLTAKHFTQAMGVCAEHLRNRLIVSALLSQNDSRYGFTFVQGLALDLYAVQLNTRERVRNDGHGFDSLMAIVRSEGFPASTENCEIDCEVADSSLGQATANRLPLYILTAYFAVNRAFYSLFCLLSSCFRGLDNKSRDRGVAPRFSVSDLMASGATPV